MCEGGLITVMKAWADCRHRLPMAKPMPVVLKAEEPRCTNAITWVHSSAVRVAHCRSAGPWFESGCALNAINIARCHSCMRSALNAQHPHRSSGACMPTIDIHNLHCRSWPRGPSCPGHTPCHRLHCRHAHRHPTPIAMGTPSSTGYIAQWLERLTADQQVPGWNPGVPSKNPLCTCAMSRSVTRVSVKS